MKRFFTCLIIFFLIFNFFGCGGKGSSNGENDGEEGPIVGGTLKIYSYSPDTLNPIFTQNNANLTMLKLIFEPLVWCDNTQSALPVLARDWETAENGLSWTVNIKEGVRFQDGAELTAEDVVFSLNCAKNGAYPSSYSENLTNVSSVTSVGRYAIRINLREPQANFINMLEVPIIRQANGAVFDNFKPVGTGPYIYAGQTGNKYILLESNADWWGGVPYITRIEAYLLPDKNTASFAYEAKEIDVTTTDFSRLGVYLGSTENRIIPFSSAVYNFIGVNHSHRDLAKAGVRKALAMSINKEKMFAELLFSQSTMTPTFINPSWGMAAEVADYSYDTKEAKRLLSDEGYSRSNLTLLVNKDNEVRVSVAEFIAQSASAAGINIRIKKVSWEEYSADIAAGNYDLFLGEYLVPNDANPSFLFREKLMNYNDEGTSAILASLHQAGSLGDIRGRYVSLQERYLEELPFISLYFENTVLLLDSKIKGDITPLKSNIFYGIAKWHIGE